MLSSGGEHERKGDIVRGFSTVLFVLLISSFLSPTTLAAGGDGCPVGGLRYPGPEGAVIVERAAVGRSAFNYL